MKKILFILLIIAACSSLYGQSLEWEILNLGLPSGFQKDGNNSINERGLFMGTEVRYNYMDKRLSTGIQLSMTGWNRFDPNGNWTQHQNPFMFHVVTDYNFTEVHPKIMPFAGTGVGFSYVRTRAQYNGYFDSDKLHFACAPRAGIEFFKRIRLTAEYQYAGNKNNFFNIKLGFVVGS